MLAWIGLLARQGIAVTIGVTVAMLSLGLFLLATEDVLFSISESSWWGLFFFAVLVLTFEAPRIRQHLRHRAHLLDETTTSAGELHQRWMGCLPMWMSLLVAMAMLVARWLWTGCQAHVLLAIPMYALLLHATMWLVFTSVRAVRLWFRTRTIPAARQTPSAFPLLAAVEVAGASLLMFVKLPHVTLLKLGAVGGLLWLQTLLPPEFQQLELLVQLGPDDSLSEVPHLHLWGTVTPAVPSATRDESVDASQTFVVRGPTMAMVGLWLEADADKENVVHVELNKMVQAEPLPRGAACAAGPGPTRDPLSGGQVALRDSGADRVLSRGRIFRARRTLLAVIDTGIDGTHEDLRGVVKGQPGPDPNGHGTAMAGIAAAIGNNGLGIASLNDRGEFFQVRDYPALVATGGNTDDIAEAIHQAVDDRADVVLMSFGVKGEAPKVVRDAIRYALGEGVIIVAAAGNDGPAGQASGQWPANVPGVLVVTALDGNRYADFSNRGGAGSVGAPGKGVCAPVAGGGYRETDGTSAAAAFVAGAVARRRAQCSESAKQTLMALERATVAPSAFEPAQLRVDRLLESCSRF